MVVICISLMAGDVEHFLMCLLAMSMSSSVRFLFMSFAHFMIGLFVSLLLSLISSFFKICMESEKTPNSQGNFKKDNHIWGHHNARFQGVLQSCGHQDSVVLAQKHNGTE